MKSKTTLKISISGARGIVGDSLTPQLAAALAQAFGTYVGGGPVLIGRDTVAANDSALALLALGGLLLGALLLGRFLRNLLLGHLLLRHSLTSSKGS